jgi:hypothetical protein
MEVDGRAIEVREGMGKYKALNENPGEYSFEIGINVPKAGGGFEMKKATGKYSVFAPAAAISADELNVIYTGLDNPLSISVAGIDPRLVRVNVSGGDVALVPYGAGKYYAKMPVRRSNECEISVSAMVGDHFVNMGTKKFQLRNVPRPAFQFGPIDFTQPVKVADLVVQTRALAVLEGFIYKSVSYSIAKYKLVYSSKSRPYGEVAVIGNSTASLIPIFKTLRAGDEIKIVDILAVGPGGALRPLPSVTTKIIN